MGNEIELKLELAAGAADALEASPPWAGDAKITMQRSIYFDTPDLTLSKSGMSLRIRQSGGKRIQTAKADGAGAAGLFVRSEWERPVKDDVPVLDEATPIRALLGDAEDSVGPAFELHIERRRWIIDENGSEIELVLDRGEAVAGERAAAICEIELELKQGDSSALFALARRLDAVAPVRLGVLSKAERGYRLLEAAPRMAKAEPLDLTGDLTAAEAFRKIVANCVRQFRLNENLLSAARNGDALHQARVGLRRLRSAFSIFKPVIAGATSAALAEDLRWLASQLGEARDLDVMLERTPPGSLHSALAAVREEAYGRVNEALASERVRELMLDLTEWSIGGDWLATAACENDGKQSAREFAATALDRFRSKVKKEGRDLAGAGDETRHDLRKDTKKLRYASEFFASLFNRQRQRRRNRKFLCGLEQLQDQLGALNDLATAPHLLEKLGLANDPAAARLLTGAKRETLLARADAAHDDLVDMKRFWR